MNANPPTQPDQQAHLDEKVAALVEQVDEGYGKALIEQLIRRMELTVRDFTSEIDQLVERLKHNADTQEELLGKIKRKSIITEPAELTSEDISDEDIPEWERRLADLERSTE